MKIPSNRILFIGILLLSTWSATCLYSQDKGNVSAKGPYNIVQKEQWVQAADGTKLWACFTFPVPTKDNERFPALLIMDPYAGDCTLERYDEAALASNGYVVAMFHVRGTGRSEGSLFDREYSEQELQDAVHLINWFGTQKWFNGNAGMFGGSWSGFNALQVAMQRPTHLRRSLPTWPLKICTTRMSIMQMAFFVSTTILCWPI